jgi:hypothetical protein
LCASRANNEYNISDILLNKTWLLAIGYWLLAITLLLAIGYWLLLAIIG